MEKLDDNIIIKVNLDLDKYSNSNSIKIRMNVSFYDSLVYVFAKLYNELNNIDINNYQIYMEEYMYLNVKNLAKTR